MIELISHFAARTAVRLGLSNANNKPTQKIRNRFGSVQIKSVHTIIRRRSGLIRELALFKRDLEQGISKLDAKYQDFFQRRVDPLFHDQRRLDQYRRIAGARKSSLKEADLEANRNIGLGFLAGIGVVGLRMGFPFMLPGLLFVGMYLTVPLIKSGYKIAVRERRISCVHLMAAYSIVLWVGGYYIAGIVGAIIYGLDRKILTICEYRSQQNLARLFGEQPMYVWVERDGIEIEIPFEKLGTGDLVVLTAGNIVPADGTVIRGEGATDQRVITGESTLADKTPGDKVFATTLLVSGKLWINVSATGSDTISGKIVEILKKSGEKTEELELTAARHADHLTLPSIGLSILSLPLLGPFAAATILGSNMTMFMFMLAPYSMLKTVNSLSGHSVLVKDGRVLQEISQAGAVVFDKTGTLTEDQLEVYEIHTCREASKERVLQIAATLEYLQSHPIAKAIIDKADELDIDYLKCTDNCFEIGSGLKARIEGQRALIGNARFIKREGIELTTQEQKLIQLCQDRGHTASLVAHGGYLIGILELAPRIRNGVEDVLKFLKKRGLKIIMISGDHQAATCSLANQLGISRWYAEVLPENKALLVRKIKEESAGVIYVGDGINDTLAMQEANVSVSLCGATTAATDTAEVILMNGALDTLPSLFIYSQRFSNSLSSNQKMLGGISFATMAGVIFFHFSFFTVEIIAGASLAAGLLLTSRSKHFGSVRRPPHRTHLLTDQPNSK